MTFYGSSFIADADRREGRRGRSRQRGGADRHVRPRGGARAAPRLGRVPRPAARAVRADPDARRLGRTVEARDPSRHAARFAWCARAARPGRLRRPRDDRRHGRAPPRHRGRHRAARRRRGGGAVEQPGNPGQRIPPVIESFTGISNEMVADAPSFDDLRAEVRRRLDGRLFVAHNARFDYGFVRNEFRRVGEKFAAPVLCTVRLSRALFREHARHNLDALIERYGLPARPGTGRSAMRRCCRRCSRRSRAAGREQRAGGGRRRRLTSRACRRTCRRISPRTCPRARACTCSGRGRRAAVRRQEPQPAQPGARAFRERAPLGQGVEADAPGARGGVDRDGRRARRAAARVAAGEGTRTERQPAACASRPACSACGSSSKTAGSRCGRAAAARPPRPTAGAVRTLPHRAGCPARPRGQGARGGAVPQAMGLERGEGSCFALQIGRCRGACVGREPRALHDARLRLALASLRSSRGRSLARSASASAAADGGTVLHVIDRWRHLGTAATIRRSRRCSRARPRTLRSGRLPHHRALPRAAAPREIVMLGTAGSRRM